MFNKFLVLNFFCLFLSFVSWAAEVGEIRNDCFRYTVDGQPMFTNGGGIFKFTNPTTGESHYYWYGVKYRESVAYVPDALDANKNNNTHFQSVVCYKSDNLTDWTFVNDIVTSSTLPGRAFWMGRCGVAYIPEKEIYALFIQMNSRVGVFTCDTPGGNYEFHQAIDMTPFTGATNTGDQTVFTDDDGQSYLCYSKPNGRNRAFISKIGVTDDGKIGLTDCHKIFQGAGREGNCMFKYKDKYYVCASDLYGWNASNLYYLVSDSIYGPYLPTDNMLVMPGSAEDYGHVTQAGCFYTLNGSKEETVIACGDRWSGFAGNGNGFSQWCPVTFDDGTPYFNSLSHWILNHETGEWVVGVDNNYAINWSFEADRHPVPISKKPRQEFLRGWITEIICGNSVAADSAYSPVLNAPNSADDRRHVMGNYSLNISDKTDFKRKVYQVVKSAGRVGLRDGDYSLSAKVNCTNGFKDLRMYAFAPEGDKKTYDAKITATEGKWVTVTIPKIKVKGGAIEIGFMADGTADAQCRIDDIELKMKND